MSSGRPGPILNPGYYGDKDSGYRRDRMGAIFQMIYSNPFPCGTFCILT